MLRRKASVVGIEVKSNAERNTAGLETFKKAFKPHVSLVVGDSGMSADEFLSMDIKTLF